MVRIWVCVALRWGIEEGEEEDMVVMVMVKGDGRWELGGVAGAFMGCRLRVTVFG